MLPHLYVSLTSIARRLDGLPKVLESLISQRSTGFTFSIDLYLSDSPYLIDEGCSNIPHNVGHILERHSGLMNLHMVENTGPHRKFASTLNKIHCQSEAAFLNSYLVTADDDTIYPNNWLELLFEAVQIFNCPTGMRGRTAAFEANQFLPYARWKKTVVNPKDFSNVATGKDGVIYHSTHLHPAVLDMRAAIEFAPKADDLWLKVHSLLLGYPTAILNECLSNEFSSIEENSNAPSLYSAFNRQGGNDAAIAQLNTYTQSFFEVSLVDLFNRRISLNDQIFNFI